MTKKAAQKEEFMKKKLTASVLAVASVLSMSTGMVFADETTAEVPEIEMADASEVDKTTISFWHSMGGVNGQAIDTLTSLRARRLEIWVLILFRFMKLELVL